jgi:hypothetical protein
MSRKLFALIFLVLVMGLAHSDAALGATTVEVRIAAGSDDAEEAVNAGSQDAYNTSSDLEITDDNVDNGGRQFIGLNFRGIEVPANASIDRAYVEFVCDETKDGTADAYLLFWGHLDPNPDGFDTPLSPTAISERPRTAATVPWEPEAWTAAGQISQSADISSIIEEIVAQPGWVSGNALEIIIGEDTSKGAYTGSRTAESFNGSEPDAPLLHIEWSPGGAARNPEPPTGQTDLPRETDLNWSPGINAAPTNGHTLYFSESFNDVNDGIGAITQSDTGYDPGLLDFGMTYYWRVDEVNSAPDFTVFRGDVWSFTVEPKALPIEGVIATASSANSADMGPEKTVDGSGLNALDQHGTMPTDMWLSGMGDATPSIQYDFDKAYKLDELLVWNSNQLIESFIGLSAKDVVIETSVDGVEWTVLEGATLFNQATGMEDYTANTSIDFGGILAQSVRITINAGYGMLPQYGLSELRFLYIPTFAREPMPADGSSLDSANVELSWRSGREAASSEVYLGTDAADLALLGTTTDNSLVASGLNYSTTYYWSVTEVNDAEAVTSYAGEVWSFTTPDFGTVDDFDQYDDKCNRIFFAWADGLGHNGGTDIPDCDVPPSNGNGGGSIVGNDVAPFAEQSTVNPGGSTQSLPLNYDNSFGPSEAKLVLDAQDWSASEVQTLSLAFYGAAGNTGTLYVKINNSKLTSTQSLALEGWQLWNVDLNGVSGLQNVTSLTIGVDGGNAAGMLYIDDIRLYPSVPEAVNEWRVSASTDDAEEHDRDFGTMESLTSSDLEMPYEQNIDDPAHQMIGCRWAGVPIPQGATITEAWVQFSADSVGNAGQDGAVSLVIEGQLATDAETFSSDGLSVSLRPKTTASVVWDVPVWTETHLMGPDERTPDISSIIQEIVNQPGWAGEALVLIFSDNPDNPSQGYREAESVDGEADEAPLLHISFE